MSTRETLAALSGGSPAATTRVGRVDRWVPLTGVLFAVAFAAGVLATGDPPATDASGQDVIAHYQDTEGILGGVVAAPIAAVLLVVFAGVLRNRLRSTGPRWPATVAFGGAVVYAAGLGLLATTQLALLDASELGQADVAQALNIIDHNNFMPLVIGMAVMLLASGWHVIASRALPAWLGWVSVALGVLALAGPGGAIAFLLFPIWVLLIAVTLLQQVPSS